MISFRKMKLGDLDKIYKDEEIRSLITVAPKGVKFAVVIELNEKIIGGASGYVDNNAAIAQCIVVKDCNEKSIYKDGLIRSLIHFLELDGIEYLLVNETDPIYKGIGFQELKGNEGFINYLGEEAKRDISAESSQWINLKEFFN